jgi:hypothetical protein
MAVPQVTAVDELLGTHTLIRGNDAIKNPYKKPQLYP